MKKKDSKPKKQHTAKGTDEWQSLNAQLGEFGLEPPKRYRSDQRLSASEKKTAPKKQRKQQEKQYPLTPQERREQQNKQRQKKKKHRKLLSYAAVAVGIIAIMLVLSLTVLFKIDTISVKGNERYSVKEIMAVLPVEKENNLFITDTGYAEEKLEATLPYIYDAEVKRHFPSTITVTVHETATVYSVKNKDKTYTLLDDRLKVLESNIEKAPKNAVELRRVALSDAIVGKTATFTNKKTQERVAALIATVKSMQLEKITAVYSTDINNNYLVYDKRITFKLGSLDNIEDKIYAALTALEKLNNANPQAEGELTVVGDKQVYFTEK